MSSQDIFEYTRLAQACVDDVSYAKELLLDGKSLECLSLLAEMERAMALVLAIDEERKIEMLNQNAFHSR